MLLQTPYELQSHSTAVTDTTMSRSGSKRASPLEDNGFGDGHGKRLCFGTAYERGSPQYLSSTGSVGVHSWSPSVAETSPLECQSWSTTNLSDNSPTPSQSGYDTKKATDKVSCERFLSTREASLDDVSFARDNSLHVFPSIEITHAESDYGTDRPSCMAKTRRGYCTTGMQFSTDVFVDDSMSSRQSNSASELDQEYYASLNAGKEGAAITDDVSAYCSSENALSVPPCDTCFGVVLLPFRSSLNVKSKDAQVPVKMVALGDMLKLSKSDSGKYAGILEAAAICTLLPNPRVTLKGTLSVTKRDNRNTEQSSRGSDTHQLSDYVLRILVCGQQSDKQSVGRLLAESEFYLQHPVCEEVGGLKYDNPHFLLRRGFEMPPLERLSIMVDTESGKTSDVLDESSISLVMRVFDSESVVDGSITTEVSDRVRARLKDHQYTALAMMQEKECGILENTRFPSLWQCFTNSDGTKRFRNTVTGSYESMPKPFYGGILADEMGLGKTLSVLSLICWSLDMQAEGSSTKTNSKSTGTTLVVAPKSTINGWQEQIKMHIKPNRIKYAIFHGTSRAYFSKSKDYNIILTTYETLRSDWSTKKTLYSQNWDRIVLDEAHHIRSPASQTFKAACELQALHRWCLSGTPICNSLTDYGSLLTFIGIRPFADRKAFRSWILDPIKKKKASSLTRLESLVRATCLRRKKSQDALKLELTTKSERIHWIDLSPEDQEVYKFFKLKTARLAVELSLRRSSSRHLGQKGDTNIVTLINVLRRICDHGKCLLPSSALEIWNERNNDSSPAPLQTLLAICDWCKRRMHLEPDNGLGCEHIICVACMANRDLESLDDDDSQCPKCMNDLSTSAKPRSLAESDANIEPSAKVVALIQNLKREQSLSSEKSNVGAPTKSLVFSVWTKVLDLLQHHLRNHGFIIARIDGSCSLQQRGQAIKRFTNDPSCTIMLASIGSAGEGIDLTAASNVHLFEPHWNPMQEAQAIDRVHRIGQQREVLVIRYLTRNSIETYVQWIQQEKIRLINRTLDSVHVSQAEIDEKRWEKLQQYIGSLSTDI